MSSPAQCPFSSRSLPGDGTPLAPSPQLAAWRESGSFAPLDFDDGHEGLIATRREAAVRVLQDPRFSMRPSRMPLGPSAPGEGDATHVASPVDHPEDLDAEARASEELLLLSLDGASHAKLRRAITARFSVRQARARQPFIAATVAAQIAELRAKGPVVDLWRDFALPIAARTHCAVIGIPDHRHDAFVRIFAGESTTQEKYDFIRETVAERRGSPGDDVITDLLQNDELTTAELESLLRLLMSSGRDSVAYLITTACVALLTHPEQLARLRAEPELFPAAIEEFMRAGAMFVTLFARTATEDVEVDGTLIPAGTSVAVSPVAANRDPGYWDGDPERFDITRDALGHLGFGHGIHGCVGQQVARVEIREAVSALIAAFPELTLVSADQLTPQPFAHPVAVYEAGHVLVRLSDDDGAAAIP